MKATTSTPNKYTRLKTTGSLIRTQGAAVAGVAGEHVSSVAMHGADGGLLQHMPKIAINFIGIISEIGGCICTECG